MNAFKKALSILLVFVMALSLSGCSLFTGRLAIAAAKNQDLQSLRTDITVDLGMHMAMGDEPADLDANASGTVDITVSPLKVKADLMLNLMGEELPILSYVEQNGNVMVAYVSLDNGASWMKSESEMPDLPTDGKLDAKSIAGLAKMAVSFEETGTETVKGEEAVVFTGSIPVADALEEMDKDAVLNTIAEASGVMLDKNDLDFSGVSPVPLTVCLGKESDMIVRCSADLTDMTNSMVPIILNAVMKAALAESGAAATEEMDPAALGFEFSFSKLAFSADLYDFDKVGEIVIPAEALAAESIAA